MSPLQQVIFYLVATYACVLILLAASWLMGNSSKARDFTALREMARNYQPWWLCPFSRNHMRIWRAVIWIGGLSWLAAGFAARV